MPKIATSDQEIEKCFNVMLELRPQLKYEMFISTVRAMQTEGFVLAYIESEQSVIAVAGYRISTSLYRGKNLYVDDLITAEKHRSKGCGEEMVSWLRGVAKDNGCHFYHLDSGTHRDQAHKFYFRQGFTISSYHFVETL